MIFLLGGRKNPAVRAIVGAILLVVGIVTHSAIFMALGALLMLWGGAQALKKVRISHETQAVGEGWRP